MIDYQRPGDGLLLAVGSGLMMATMDALPRLRFCIDVGGGANLPGLADYLVWVHDKVGIIVVHAWYSVSPPERLAFGLRRVPARKLITRANVDLPGQRVQTFEDLIVACS